MFFFDVYELFTFGARLHNILLTGACFMQKEWNIWKIYRCSDIEMIPAFILE